MRRAMPERDPAFPGDFSRVCGSDGIFFPRWQERSDDDQQDPPGREPNQECPWDHHLSVRGGSVRFFSQGSDATSWDLISSFSLNSLLLTFSTAPSKKI